MRMYICFYNAYLIPLEKAHECAICGAQFVQKRNLNRHMDQAHPTSRVKPYECTVCKARYVRDSDLNRHIERVHNTDSDRPQKKKARRDVPSSRAVHPAAAASISPPSPGSADDDNQPDTSFRDLRENVEGKRRRLPPRVKGNLTQYPCQHCNSLWQSEAKLRDHLVGDHQVEPNAFELENEGDGRPHKCSQCMSSFNKTSTLRDHEKRKHQPIVKQFQIDDAESSKSEESDVETSGNVFEQPQKLYKFLSGPRKRYNQTFHATEEDTEYMLSKQAVNVCEDGYTYEVMEGH